MCRKTLFEKNFLTYASWISMQIKACPFLHILNVYSHTKLNTLVLVWSLQLSNFGLNHVTEHFSVTIDCVRFLIRRFPLYAYSMIIDKDPDDNIPEKLNVVKGCDISLITLLTTSYLSVLLILEYRCSTLINKFYISYFDTVHHPIIMEILSVL